MPKTLVQVFDKPLINHLLQNCINAGIKDAVIVTGHNESMIREHLSYNTSDINIEFIYNKNWKLENGVSVLAAKDAIPNGEDFLLSMSDHYYKFDLLNKIIKSEEYLNIKLLLLSAWGARFWEQNAFIHF